MSIGFIDLETPGVTFEIKTSSIKVLGIWEEWLEPILRTFHRFGDDDIRAVVFETVCHVSTLFPSVREISASRHLIRVIQLLRSED